MCLRTDPAERATTEQLMRHKWITHYNKNPTTQLETSKVLREEQVNWPEVSVRVRSKQPLLKPASTSASNTASLMGGF